MFFFILPISNIVAAVAGSDLPYEFYEKLLAVKDGHGFHATIDKDGVYIKFPGHLIKEPHELSRKTISQNNEKVLGITMPAPYRFVQKDGSFSIEEFVSTSGEWTPFFNSDIPGTCSYFPEYFFRSNSFTSTSAEGVSTYYEISDLYKTKSYYRIQKLENQEFVVQSNSKPEDANEADWKTIFSAKGIVDSDFTTDHRFCLHLKWRSEHHGNQVATLDDADGDEAREKFSNFPGVWDVQYSCRHADTRLISFRDAPGRPLKYALWEGANKTGEYDTNIEGFAHFPDVDMFYLQNTLDESLPEDHPFRLAGLDVPVSRYQTGTPAERLRKMTLAYIKGGPVITKLGEFDSTYHALAQYFNVYVIEYRGSDPRMGEVGSAKYLRGDIGGGIVRDVVSVLRAMQQKAHPKFSDIDPDNIVLAGHSFGGFALAKIMQDYTADIERIKGFLLLSPVLDILNMGKFCGSPHRGHCNNYMEYLFQGETLATRNSGTIFKYCEVEDQIIETNKAVSPAQTMDKMPTKFRSLIVAPTHDGNVSVEQSMKFYIEWLRKISPLTLTIPDALSELDTYDTFAVAESADPEYENWIFTRSDVATHEMLGVFNEWAQSNSVQLATQSVQMHLVEGATHSYKDTPEIFKAYVEKIRDFAASL